MTSGGSGSRPLPSSQGRSRRSRLALISKDVWWFGHPRVVPLDGSNTFGEVRAAVTALCTLIHRADPQITTREWRRRARRKGVPGPRAQPQGSIVGRALLPPGTVERARVCTVRLAGPGRHRAGRVQDRHDPRSPYGRRSVPTRGAGTRMLAGRGDGSTGSATRRLRSPPVDRVTGCLAGGKKGEWICPCRARSSPCWLA